MAKDAPVAVAYVPFKTFLTSLDTLRQGVPDPIDRSVFRSQSGSTQGMLLSSYKALGLINDEHEPQPILHRLVEPEQRKAALREILENRYAEILALGPAATQKQFDDLLGAYGIGGDTKKKAKSFFVQAADMAGIKLSPYISPRNGESGSATPRTPGAKRRPRKVKREEGAVSPNVYPLDQRLFGRLHPAVQAWIDEMPSKEESWERGDFENWLAIFKASVERAYKIL